LTTDVTDNTEEYNAAEAVFGKMLGSPLGELDWIPQFDFSAFYIRAIRGPLFCIGTA
jgi:hypothetical protein